MFQQGSAAGIASALKEFGGQKMEFVRISMGTPIRQTKGYRLHVGRFAPDNLPVNFGIPCTNGSVPTTNLGNRRFLQETVQRLIGGGLRRKEDGWSGWLGRYQRALHEAAATLEHERLGKRVEFEKDRSRGL